jgi:hypothetical protein
MSMRGVINKLSLDERKRVLTSIRAVGGDIADAPSSIDRRYSEMRRFMELV